MTLQKRRSSLQSLFNSQSQAWHTSSSQRAPNIRQSGSDPLGISCRLCYKPAERLSGSLVGCSHDDGTASNISRAIDPSGNRLQPGNDRLPLPHHAKSRRDDL